MQKGVSVLIALTPTMEDKVLIHSHMPLTAEAIQAATDVYRTGAPEVGDVICTQDFLILCHTPGVLQVEAAPETENHMPILYRSAYHIGTLGLGQCVWAFTITDREDTMVRYAADRSRDHVVSRVSAYLKSHHPSWRMTKVEKVSKIRTLGDK
jgi:hypothetical protein